jgi:hypothetical protein
MVPISDEIIQVNWKTVSDCLDSLPTTSLIHAIYTTMYGRMELYNYMDFLQERCSYVDTDAAVFLAKPGLPDPPLGPYLGQLSDEFEGYGPGSFCYEWVTGGAKQYAMKVACAGDVDNTAVIIKLRGVTVNYSCADIVTFDRFKEMVLAGRDPTVVPIPSQIARVKGWNIVTRPSAKIWQPHLNKRQLKEDKITSHPFGYKDVQLDEDDLATLEAMLLLDQ